MDNDNIYSSPLAVVEQFFFCGVPLRLDTYSGCTHRCKYCFARAIEIGHNVKRASEDNVLPTDPQIIRHALWKALDSGAKSADIAIEWLRRRIPIHWGGMSDPFQPIEKDRRVSLNIMRHLNWYQYPTVISTKGTEILTEPNYVQSLLDGRYAVQISLISSDDKLVSTLEPGAPNASHRLSAMETLSGKGLWVACRIQPMIIGSIVEKGLVDFIRQLASVGVKHIVVEAYKPPVWNPPGRATVNEICGGKVELEYSCSGTQQVGMELLLPAWRKWEYLQVVITEAHRYGITVGAADNDLRDMGDTECCCGVDNLKGFENIWTYQTGRMATIAKRKGVVTLDDMSNEWTGECKFNFNKQGLTMENGVRVRETPKYYIDKVFRWGDQRSPNYLVNMAQITHNGSVAYRYEYKLDRLCQASGKQGVMELI